MSDTAYSSEHAKSLPEGGMGNARDFFQLLKPRVMSLVIFTALVGIAAAPGGIHPVIAFTALLCIAVGAGASGALNMWYDADIDARMARNVPVISRPDFGVGSLQAAFLGACWRTNEPKTAAGSSKGGGGPAGAGTHPARRVPSC